VSAHAVADVFISYSRRDKQFVERLNRGLEARGKDAWVDVDDIPASAQWLREIQEGIDASDAFLVVLSPDSLGSGECAREVEHALDRRKRILPVVHRDIDPGEVRPEVASINWVYLRDDDPFEQGVDAVVRALDTDLDYVKAHTRLANQAINWDRAGRDRARLLRGTELQDAERWLTEAAGKEPGPTEVQAQFVQASRDAARRRGRMLFGGVAVALVVAVVLAIVALIQRSNAIHQSQIAYSRQLDAEAQNNYSSDPELSVLLATEAARTAPGAATREALRQALVQSNVRDRYTNPHGPVGDAIWSPSSDRLLISDENANQAEIVQPGTHAKPIILRAPGLDTQIGWDARGRLAVTGGAETQIWNGITGGLVRRLPTRSAQAALSPDGTRVATLDEHGLLHIWSVATGAQLRQIRPAGLGNSACLHWSPNGSVLAVCEATGTAKQLASRTNVPETLTVVTLTGRRLLVIHQPEPIIQAVFSPDSRRLALAVAVNGDAPGTLVYDLRTGARLLARPGSATAVAFSPDGKELAYAQIQGAIAYVYTFANGTSEPLVGNTGTIQSIAFSHTGTYVATSSGDDTARVFNWYFGTQLEVMAGHKDEVTDATFSRDDTLLATASRDGTARVWTTPMPQALAQHLLGSYQQYVSVSPDGTAALLAGPASSTALVLNARTLSTRATLNPPSGQLFGGGGFSPDGRWMAALSGKVESTSFRPLQLEVYDTDKAGLSATIARAGAQVQDAVFDRSGHVATLFTDGEVDLWSAATGRRQRTLVPAGRPADTVSFSSDGAKLAVSYPDGSIDLLSASGRHLHTLVGAKPGLLVAGDPASPPAVVRTAFSPNGAWLAAAGAGDGVQVFSVASGREVRRFPAGSEPLISVAFSPRGNVLAGGDSATAYLWPFPSGSPMRILAHAAPSTWGPLSELTITGGVRVAFSSDGGTLLTSGDTQTRLWRVQTSEPLLTIPFAVGGALTPGARRIVADSSGVLGVFGCHVCGGLPQLMATAHQNLTRGFTPAERALYLR
jgi:WD40 repeat protein